MQNVSKAYKSSMKQIGRNRGYIKVTIGVINSNAQKYVQLDEAQTGTTYYSDNEKPFNAYAVDRVYATAEQDFSHVDGTMYFLPKESSNLTYYNAGIVTNAILGSIYINFDGQTGFDIKGLTIDFGEYYPTDFTVTNDNITRSYNGNDKRYWVTEDVWDGTSYFIITPSAMVNGQGRLRINTFSCGIVNSFTNVETRSYTLKETCSSITDTIPSTDMTLEVDNQDLYYSPDNSESTLAYFEVGQEMKVSFGYDVLGDDVIEWLPEKTAYLKTWSADDTKAKFTATDRFDYMSDTYAKGKYRPNGISLYDLAIDVIEDMGITDEREYFIDPYLKDIYVKNPMPQVKHSEALQIIANAGRCSLSEDRNNRIHIQASFVPDMTASSNGEMGYSHVANILQDEDMDAYAEASQDYSTVDGTMYFMPKDTNYLNTGYISSEIADEGGAFETNPKITIDLEAAFVAYGLLIRFRNTYPTEFHVITYNEGVLVADLEVTDNDDTTWVTYEQFDYFDQMVIEFTVGAPNSRVFVDNIIVGDVTDYTIERDDMSSTPTATRQNKIKSISVVRTLYYNSTESEAKDLTTETITLDEDTEYTVTFSNPSYGLAARIVLETDDEGNEISVPYSVSITESSDYYAVLKFEGITANSTFTYAVSGYEYATSEVNYTVSHNDNGECITWSNPLISDISHAKDVEEWLASYYLGDVDYQISWRGDPRVDVNDLFYMELKDRPKTMIRAYQNELKFSGAWSGTLKARKAVLRTNGSD